MTTYTRLLELSHGVFRVGHLRATGATASDIRAAVSSGALSRIRKGWLHTPDAAPDLVRAVSLGGRLACVSAARQRGLWTPDTSAQLHIARPRHAGRTYGDAGGCVEHWQSVNWSTRLSAVEAVPALVRQAILCCTYEDALTVIDSALNQRRMSRPELAGILSSLPPKFSRVLDDVDPASESGLETLSRHRLKPLGLPIRSQVHFRGVGRVDLLLGDRLILEADGRGNHASSFLADRTRDLALARLGYVVLRVGYHHVVNEWQLVEQTVRALAHVASTHGRGLIVVRAWPTEAQRAARHRTAERQGRERCAPHNAVHITLRRTTRRGERMTGAIRGVSSSATTARAQQRALVQVQVQVHARGRRRARNRRS